MSAQLRVTPPKKAGIGPSDETWLAHQVIGNGWRVTHSVIPTGSGAARYAGYTLESEEGKALPAQPPTARQLRLIATGDRVLREVLRTMDERGEYRVMAWMDGFAVPPPRLPRRYNDLYYARWANAYLHAWKQGRGAIAQLARDRGIARTAYIYEVLAVARQRGLLTRAPQGKGGGELTPKARKLLEADDGSST